MPPDQIYRMAFPVEGFVDVCAEYPPVVETHPVPSGYLQDINRIGYSRDIGRSSFFAGHYYYLFGDTFCKNRHGEYVGVTGNTIAIVPDNRFPLDSQYLSIQPDGMVDPFLTLNEDETLLQQNGVRVALWPFGGIVETAPEVGWIWYQKLVLYPNDYQNYHGVGIARISKAASPRGQLSTFRVGSLIFGADEPRFGSFSALLHEDFVYLWGDYKGSIVLARVNRYLLTSRNSYKYWDGEQYGDRWQDSRPVLQDMQHGNFFRSTLFGTERPWCFVGCSKFADSVVMMGAEASLEGPWSLTPLFRADGIGQPGGYRYCIYAHPWALDPSRGDLLVTWSENWPGGVVGANVKLVMGNSLVNTVKR